MSKFINLKFKRVTLRQDRGVSQTATERQSVIPAKAGIQVLGFWIPVGVYPEFISGRE